MNIINKPVIACIHLLPTPGTHLYNGDIDKIYETAIMDAKIFMKNKVDALIVENFRDWPFYPEVVPAETIATLAGVTREIINIADVPVGVAVLRNDAEAAMAIATAVKASFIRVNVHIGAVLTEQGIIQGKSHNTLRLRNNLKSNVAIYADAKVKHSTPLAYQNLDEEIRDLSERADAVIVSGAKTGIETKADDLTIAKQETKKPVLVGSGVTPENLHKIYKIADGFIVGSYFKKDGKGGNLVEESRVRRFMDRVTELRQQT